ncbi:MAG: ribosomal-protein-alanine N-acetyltransferase [Nitrospiraceae bacterium]|nr:MAG: ribosomal-protein-alanine N-acetyltransferase [Nitrospiraceae bacterium]
MSTPLADFFSILPGEGPAMGEWIIEPATVEALPDILQIEEACFSAPWTRKMLEAELGGNPFAHFLLAKWMPPGEVGSVSIVGYLCFWVVFEEVRLMNLAVIESMRHKGIARALVRKALEVGLAQAARCAVLELRASNHAAHALYRSLGFCDVTTRPTYYTNPIEDALLMELDPITSASGLLTQEVHREGGCIRPLQ